MEGKRNIIRNIRKGSVQWNEEDRLKMAEILLKAGYVVRIKRQNIPAEASKSRARTEYVIEYWEEEKDAD